MKCCTSNGSDDQRGEHHQLCAEPRCQAPFESLDAGVDALRRRAHDQTRFTMGRPTGSGLKTIDLL